MELWREWTPRLNFSTNPKEDISLDHSSSIAVSSMKGYQLHHNGGGETPEAIKLNFGVFHDLTRN